MLKHTRTRLNLMSLERRDVPSQMALSEPVNLEVNDLPTGMDVRVVESKHGPRWERYGGKEDYLATLDKITFDLAATRVRLEVQEIKADFNFASPIDISEMAKSDTK